MANQHIIGGDLIDDDHPLPITGGAGGGSADFGTAPTGQTPDAGGSGNLGWLGTIRKVLTDRLGTLGQKAMAASTPVVVASDQTAVPVSSATLATAAKQPALGTAGAAATDVITVQGIASGTAQPVSVPADPFGANADAAVAAGATGSLSAKLRAISRDLVANIVLAAGSNLIGKVGAYLQTDKIYNDATALTPKFAFANIAASTTDGAVVAAVTSKKIRVLAFIIETGATATNLTFTSKPGGAGSAISMLFANGANGGAAPGFNPVGWFETASGEGLSATTGAGSTTGVHVVYVEV